MFILAEKLKKRCAYFRLRVGLYRFTYFKKAPYTAPSFQGKVTATPTPEVPGLPDFLIVVSQGAGVP